MRKNDFSRLVKYLLIMELRFDTMLYSNLGNENFGAGHINCSGFPRGIETIEKVLNCESGFQDLEKVLNLAKIFIKY